MKVVIYARAIMWALLFSFAPWAPWAQDNVSAEIENIRAAHHLPGISAMAVKKGRILAQGSAGIRRQGDSTPLLASDPINIASCTKWMTATMVGRLVDRGILRWDLRVREVFTNYATFNPAFPEITLDQLLCHQGRIEDSVSFQNRHGAQFLSVPGNISEIRRWVADTVLKDPPAPLGTYANQGYTVIGAMVEIVTGKDWETLLREEVLEPLRMHSSGVGIVFDDALPPKAPVGHSLAAGGTIPKPVGRVVGNVDRFDQAAYGPGAYVTCTLQDWAKFLHMQMTSDLSDYLSPGTAAQLQGAFSGVQGYGRGVNAGLTRAWASPGYALNHSGDVFGEDCVFWAAPARDFFVLVFTNCHSDDNATGLGLDAVAGLLVQRYSNATPAGPWLEAPTMASFLQGRREAIIEYLTLPGVYYSNESSSDLVTWKPLGAPNGTLARSYRTVFSEANSARQAFYRAVALP